MICGIKKKRLQRGVVDTSYKGQPNGMFWKDLGQNCYKKKKTKNKNEHLTVTHTPVTMPKHEISLLVTYQPPTLKGGVGVVHRLGKGFNLDKPK